jgi:hypothetical protein
MHYPVEVLPQVHFKKINEPLPDYFLCRKVIDRQALLPAPIIDEALLGLEKASDCFDYSTNLPGMFALYHNQLEIVGENKKYFRTYWEEGAQVTKPTHLQDFVVNERIGWFYLPIAKLEGLRIPFNRNNNPPASEIATSVVLHTPTNSNFWHFSIRWKDQTGTYIDANKSAWQKQVIAKVRALFSEIVRFADIPIQEIKSEWYQ